MTEPEEDELLARLARILGELEPVPALLLRAADAAIDTRDPDAELADLVADSVAGSTTGQAGGFEPVRHAGTAARLLSFDGGGLRIELEVLPEGDTFTLLGQVFGGAAEECALESGTGRPRPVRLDGLGRFLVGGVATGPVRLRCQTATGRVVTAWVTL